MVKPRFPSEARQLVRKYIRQSGSTIEPGSPEFEHALERFAEKYNHVEKEIFRGVLAYSAIGILYLLKIIGVRLDIAILSQQVFEIPYGLFAYTCISLLLFIFVCMRAIDVAFYAAYVKEMCWKKWGSGGDLMYHSYVGERSWMVNYYYFSNRKKLLTPVLKVIDGVYMILIALGIYLPILLSPLIIGITFLAQWETQAVGNFRDAQWWLILALVIGSGITGALLMTLTETSDPWYEKEETQTATRNKNAKAGPARARQATKSNN